jgi:hypothetical protein
MRVSTSLLLGLVGLALPAGSCGGSTVSVGSGDASLDATSSSGSGSSSGGSSGGSGGGSGSGSSSGSSSGGSASGGSSGGPDASIGCKCQGGLACCGGKCVNEGNDPKNCGGCGVTCSGNTPYCAGHCEAPPCEQDAASCGSATCCGTQCCGPGDLCCQLEEGVWITQCVTPTSSQPTCPVGCPMCVSDRNLKRDIEPVDPRAVLAAVAEMPVSTWSYKSDDPSVRHMGPMAQDLYAAFGLGGTDKAYSPVDAHGLAFAAIQGLYERLEEQDARIEKLERENAALTASRPTNRNTPAFTTGSSCPRE